MVFKVIAKYLAFLPDRFQAPARKLDKLLTGVSETPAQWSRCTERTILAFGYTVGAMFVDAHFLESDKERVNVILDDIVREFTSNLDDVTWMDDVTKTAAHTKLALLGRKLAYPEFIKSSSRLDLFYENVIMFYIHVVHKRYHFLRIQFLSKSSCVFSLTSSTQLRLRTFCKV